jgi:hypothetical protein
MPAALLSPDSSGRSNVLEEELGQLRSALAADLSGIRGEVMGLVTDGVFHGASGVLTSVVSHYLTLDFEAVRRGYASGWSADRLCKLGVSRNSDCGGDHR